MHETVNQQLHFIDLETRSNNQYKESACRCVKMRKIVDNIQHQQIVKLW